MGFKIRAFNSADRNALIEIFKLNTPQFFDKNEQKDFEDFLDKHADTYFVAEEDEKIVGCGGYYYLADKTVGRVSWDLFHPDSKGKGYGKHLVSHCIEMLKAEPIVKTLVVWTSQYAYGFYGKFGFETKEVRRNFWGPGIDLYRMELNI